MTINERLKDHPDCTKFFVEINLIGVTPNECNTFKFWISEIEWRTLSGGGCKTLIENDGSWLDFDNTFIRMAAVATISFKVSETTIAIATKRLFTSVHINKKIL